MFGSCELNGGRLGYPRNDLAGIERENGGVRVDGVRVEYFQEIDGFEDWFGEVCSERIFIWTTNYIDGTSAPTPIFRTTNLVLTCYTSAPLLEKPITAHKRRSAGRTREERGKSQWNG